MDKVYEVFNKVSSQLFSNRESAGKIMEEYASASNGLEISERDVLTLLERIEKEPSKDLKSLNKKQKKTFDMLISKGAIHHPEDGLDNCVWWQNRCLLISKDGSYDEV